MLEETKLEELNIVELEERFEPVAAEYDCYYVEDVLSSGLLHF